MQSANSPWWNTSSNWKTVRKSSSESWGLVRSNSNSTIRKTIAPKSSVLLMPQWRSTTGASSPNRTIANSRKPMHNCCPLTCRSNSSSSYWLEVCLPNDQFFTIQTHTPSDPKSFYAENINFYGGCWAEFQKHQFLRMNITLFFTCLQGCELGGPMLAVRTFYIKPLYIEGNCAILPLLRFH